MTDKIGWTPCAKFLPENDGTYYVLILHNEEGIRFTRVKFIDKHWATTLSNYETIVAWKPLAEPTVKQAQWLSEHIETLKRDFSIDADNINLNGFVVVPSFEDCLCDYGGFITYDCVKYIDGMYVIHMFH